ncbi:hypothetical protein U1Q18_013623 [Sarracenia purpurea var. burkii]
MTKYEVPGLGMIHMNPNVSFGGKVSFCRPTYEPVDGELRVIGIRFPSGAKIALMTSSRRSVSESNRLEELKNIWKTLRQERWRSLLGFGRSSKPPSIRARSINSLSLFSGRGFLGRKQLSLRSSPADAISGGAKPGYFSHLVSPSASAQIIKVLLRGEIETLE